MIKGNSFVIRVGGTNEAFEYLESKGFENIHHLSIDKYRFSVFVVSVAQKRFWGTNVTCMAAARPTVYTLDDIKELIESMETEVVNNTSI